MLWILFGRELSHRRLLNKVCSQIACFTWSRSTKMLSIAFSGARFDGINCPGSFLKSKVKSVNRRPNIANIFLIICLPICRKGQCLQLACARVTELCQNQLICVVVIRISSTSFQKTIIIVQTCSGDYVGSKFRNSRVDNQKILLSTIYN